MNFDWDEEKNIQNISKHGLDFNDAREIFEAPMLVNLDNRKDYGEPRYIGIGILKNFIVVLVFTEEKDDIIRIISLRKALKHEREKFIEELKNGLGSSE